VSQSRRGPPFLRPAIALLIFCLAGLIYWEVNPQPELPAPKGPSPHRGGVTQAAERQDFTMPPFRSFGEVQDRPLFSPTRRPDAEVETSAAPQATPSRLVGIVFSQSDRVAIVEIGQPASIERVAEGGRVGNWTIERILPDRIIVRNPAGRAEIKPSANPNDVGKTAAGRRPSPVPANAPPPRS
jgi:hypothetical protein